MNLTFSLSLFSVFFISSLLLHNSLSLSSHLSVIVGIFWRGLLKLANDGLWFLLMMGCSSSVKTGWVLWVVVRWRKHWSSGGGAMCVLFCVFWSALIWVLLNKCDFLIFGFCVLCFDRGWSGLCSTTMCVFSGGILVEVLLNNYLGFDKGWSFFLFFFLNMGFCSDGILVGSGAVVAWWAWWRRGGCD